MLIILLNYLFNLSAKRQANNAGVTTTQIGTRSINTTILVNLFASISIVIFAANIKSNM